MNESVYSIYTFIYMKTKGYGTYKGKYTPQNPKKYKGNVKGIIFRSLWERAFMTYCDKNKYVLEWSSEELVIPYISPKDNERHRYFPDFWLKIKNKEGQEEELIIEIKPSQFAKAPEIKLTPKTGRPTKTYLNALREYTINRAKWESAHKYCEKQNKRFIVLTEEDLFGKKK